MKEIIIKTQAEFDALPAKFEEYTRIIIKNTATRISVVARENSSVVARGNSSVEAWENSSVVARENSSVEARGNSSVEAWENSSVVARENSSVVAWENSSVVARENSSVVAWGNSSVEAWENSVVRIFSEYLRKVALYGFAVAFIPVSIDVNIEKNSEHCHIQHIKDLGWFENNAIEKTETVILYKKVSEDFKTQEGTEDETTWTVGSKVTHSDWKPDIQECGKGKFHACSRPYFCDEFRNRRGDRYIAIAIKLKDLHEWKDNPGYPHKIAFKTGKVLYECNKYGKKKE